MNSNKKNLQKRKKKIAIVKIERPLIKQKNHDSPNSISLMGHLVRPKKSSGPSAMKIYDLALNVSNPSTTPILTALFAPVQGVALNQRIGDLVYIDGIEIVYTCNAANADIFSSLRVMIFQWHVSNALIAPVAADVLQLAADGIYAMLDYGFEDQYTVLYDQLHTFGGLATAPTSGSNQASHKIITGMFKTKCVFGAGLTTGSNVIYLLTVSDSAIAPTPNLVFKSRITFQEVA